MKTCYGGNRWLDEPGQFCVDIILYITENNFLVFLSSSLAVILHRIYIYSVQREEFKYPDLYLDERNILKCEASVSYYSLFIDLDTMDYVDR